LSRLKIRPPGLWPADLVCARVLSAERGDFAVTGQAVGPYANRKLNADTGNFTFTFEDAILTYTPAGTYTLYCSAGIFELTGLDAGLTVARKLSANYGSFALAGQSVNFLVSRKLF